MTTAWLLDERERTDLTIIARQREAIGGLVHADRLHDLAHRGVKPALATVERNGVSMTDLRARWDALITEATDERRGVLITSMGSVLGAVFSPPVLEGLLEQAAHAPQLQGTGLGPGRTRNVHKHPLVAATPVSWSRLGAEQFALIRQRSQATIVRFGHQPVAAIVPRGLLQAMARADIEIARATNKASFESWSAWYRPDSYQMLSAMKAGRGFQLTFDGRPVGGVLAMPTFLELLDEVAEVRGGRFLQTYQASLDVPPPVPPDEALALVRAVFAGTDDLRFLNGLPLEAPGMPDTNSMNCRRAHVEQMLSALQPGIDRLAQLLTLRNEDPAAYRLLVRGITDAP